LDIEKAGAVHSSSQFLELLSARDAMSRRSVIVLLSGVALACLPAAQAQQGVPVIAFLHSGSPQINAGIVEAFRHGLKDRVYRGPQYQNRISVGARSE
jgi:hypothetical protein